MYYTYILRSILDATKTYVGFSADLKTRLATHNAGGSPHTAKHRPWALAFYAAFSNEKTAKTFEIYLKTHSGRLFASKHLIECIKK
jgi:predicted GIY-YIG superfamily endonuclease